jgi:two-component system, NarL family, sensor histidine kinase UhpB
MVRRLRDSILRLLHIPLLYKVVLTNCVVTAMLALAGAVVAIEHVQAQPADAHFDLVALFLGTSIVVSFVVGFLLMRVVLAPLDQIETAVDDAVHGKQHPITSGLLADRRLDQLLTAFNIMQHSLDESVQRTRLLSQQVLYAQEAERQRVARDLHDKVAQTLTSVLLYLKLLEKSSDPDEIQRLQNLRKLIAHALNDMRQLAVELHPKILEEVGLVAALSERAAELSVDDSQLVTFQAVGCTSERLPRDLEIAFYHVAQEALNNMMHHSHARCTQVSLRLEPNYLTLEVQDDGVGFDPNDNRATGASGFGLASMRERLDLVGGKLVIESRPGSGTRVCASAPVFALSSIREIPGAMSSKNP